MVELVNEGAGTADLFDMSLTDDPNAPRKFVFTTHVMLAPGQRLILFADDPDGSSGIHVGFGLDNDGDGLYLYDSVAGGGEQLDGVAFGTQLEDVSLVRRPDGSWGLGAPTFGAANTFLPMGNASNLKINEWLASAAAPFTNDFIEIFNKDPLPVDLGGLYITDQPDTLARPAPDRAIDVRGRRRLVRVYGRRRSGRRRGPCRFQAQFGSGIDRTVRPELRADRPGALHRAAQRTARKAARPTAIRDGRSSPSRTRASIILSLTRWLKRPT